MDTFTQIALGAAVGQATAGRQSGRIALAWGGFCGLLPDLDMLVPYGDVVRQFTYHRAASHSLAVLTAATPLLVWGIGRLHPRTRAHRVRWHVLVFLALVTHVLLDCCTVYGTQILWPFDPTPIAWSTIFIVDPLYSLPLALGITCALLRPVPGHRWSNLALASTTAYLLWAAGIKLVADRAVRATLAREGIATERVLTAPAPLQTLLWRFVAVDGAHYYEGFYSLLDGTSEATVRRFEHEPQLLEPVADDWSVARLRWFMKGYGAVSKASQNVVLTDLRMGMEPFYVFRFVVARLDGDRVRPVTVVRERRAIDWSRLWWVWDRIWDPKA